MRIRHRTLALGSSESAFYRSLRHVTFAFGDITFQHETEFDPPDGILDAMERGGFDQVLMPNPYGNEQRLSCYRALRDAGKRVIASDRGALPDAWFFDHGFNQDSPSYAPEAWDQPLSDEQRTNVRAYMDTLRQSADTLEAQGRRQSRDALKSRLGLDGKKILFVPLQRPSDTVVRHFSGAVDSLEELVQWVSEAERELEACTGDAWRVILKKHPLETDYIIPPNERIKYVTDDVHIHDLLEISDAVVVLNSGVGLLSLIFGKPTLHVGEALYGHGGLGQSVASVSEMVDAVQDAPGPDAERVERLVHHLITSVYSFADFTTELTRQRDGSLMRVTRRMKFRELRILGESVRVPDAHVLVVTPVVPWPIYRGSQTRIDMMIRALVDDNKLVSLCVLNMSFNLPNREIVRELRTRYPAIHRIEVRKHPKLSKWPQRWARVAARRADGLSGGKHRVSNFETCPANIRRTVQQVVEELEPEYVLVNYAKMTPALPKDYRGVTIIDTHDYQTQFLKEDQELNGVRRNIRTGVFARSEARALRQYDRIIAINPLESHTFRDLCPRARIHTVPAFSEPIPPRKSFLNWRYELLFVGSLSNFNVKGLLWFMREVLPLVRAELPDVRLGVVGNIIRSKEIEPEGYPGVDFAGVVPDLVPLYEQSKIVLAPLLGGAGMKIKVVEAMGAAKAIVLTTRAAEGIALKHRESAWVADDPRQFAEGVIRLVKDDELRDKLAAGALALHQEEHSPAAVAQALHEVFAR